MPRYLLAIALALAAALAQAGVGLTQPAPGQVGGPALHAPHLLSVQLTSAN